MDTRTMLLQLLGCLFYSRLLNYAANLEGYALLLHAPKAVGGAACAADHFPMD